MVRNIDRASRLQTDELYMYRPIGKEFKGGHGTVQHSAHQYAKGKDYTNSAENFFSILKRGLIGTYQNVSEAHLGRYLSEFDFRYTNRKISDHERAMQALKGIAGKRLTYRRTYEAQVA